MVKKLRLFRRAMRFSVVSSCVYFGVPALLRGFPLRVFRRDKASTALLFFVFLCVSLCSLWLLILRLFRRALRFSVVSSCVYFGVTRPPQP
ncbi:MAG: hypothetical protein ACI4RT_08905, partial [Candidatus Spyradenecus sp.]